MVRGDHGVGALFAPLVRSLTAQADSLPAEVGPRLAANVVELLATALCEVTAGSAPQAAPRAAPRAAHLLRAQRYIAGHLADQDLSPTGVAQALRVSVRYLYLLFQAEGTSPARWILERRLERASRLLADSRQAGWTITDIAFSVGFKDASHFTRAFKNTHGCCPASTAAPPAADPDSGRLNTEVIT